MRYTLRKKILWNYANTKYWTTFKRKISSVKVALLLLHVLVSACPMSSQLTPFHLNWVCCNRSQPRQTRSLHCTWPSSLWLQLVAVQSFQMKWGDTGWDEKNDNMNIPIILSTDSYTDYSLMNAETSVHLVSINEHSYYSSWSQLTSCHLIRVALRSDPVCNNDDQSEKTVRPTSFWLVSAIANWVTLQHT